MFSHTNKPSVRMQTVGVRSNKRWNDGKKRSERERDPKRETERGRQRERWILEQCSGSNHDCGVCVVINLALGEKQGSPVAETLNTQDHTEYLSSLTY